MKSWVKKQNFWSKFSFDSSTSLFFDSRLHFQRHLENFLYIVWPRWKYLRGTLNIGLESSTTIRNVRHTKPIIRKEKSNPFSKCGKWAIRNPTLWMKKWKLFQKKRSKFSKIMMLSWNIKKMDTLLCSSKYSPQIVDQYDKNSLL